MYAFKYPARPRCVRLSALLTLGKLDDRQAAGGSATTLLPTMKNRLASFRPTSSRFRAFRSHEHLVADISDGGAQGHDRAALTTIREINESAEMRAVLPGLGRFRRARLAIRPCAIAAPSAASISNNDPAADYPSALLALGATIVTNKRKIAADDFFTGTVRRRWKRTKSSSKVIFTGRRGSSAMPEFRNPASRYAMVGVAVAKRERRRARCVDGRWRKRRRSAGPRPKQRWRASSRRSRWKA